jgi:hypothetical protein
LIAQYMPGIAFSLTANHGGDDLVAHTRVLRSLVIIS